jgi:pimeloyl-ACP methyl ester carboxylesterase
MGNMESETIVFNRDVPLAGTLYRPSGPGPHPALVVLHGSSGGERHSPFYRHLAERLPPAGIAVFLYDRRGSGESGGDFETADFEVLAADGAAAANALTTREDIDPARIGVYGISQGGWIAPIVAARRPATACVVVVSGSGVSPAEQMDYATARVGREMGFDEAVVERVLYLRGRVNAYYRGQAPRAAVQAELDSARGEPWYGQAFQSELPADIRASKWFYEMDYDPLPIWREVRQPTLFLFAEDDRWIPVARSRAAFEAATAHLSDVTFAEIPDGDHLMGLEDPADPRISESYLGVLLTWLRNRL